MQYIRLTIQIPTLKHQVNQHALIPANIESVSTNRLIMLILKNIRVPDYVTISLLVVFNKKKRLQYTVDNKTVVNNLLGLC